MTKFDSYRAETLRAFFDELDSGSLHLTQEIIESNDFLHCYFATLYAAVTSRRKEKILYLARLLKGEVAASVGGTDEFEEMLSVIEELSYRELALLSLISKHERLTPIKEREIPS